MSYVIVARGPAGVVAAETLRKLDPSGEVTLMRESSSRPIAAWPFPIC